MWIDLYTLQKISDTPLELLSQSFGESCETVKRTYLPFFQCCGASTAAKFDTIRFVNVIL